MDESSLRAQIVDAIADAASGHLDAEELLDRIPDFDVLDLNEFRHLGYEFRTWFSEYIAEDHEQLERLRPFNLSSAPEPVAVIPIGPDGRNSVSLTRYAACVGERLVNAWDVAVTFRPEACRRFWDEMQRLAAKGIMHPYARHPMHWWVGAESGTIVLDSWSAVRFGSPSDLAELLASIKCTLDLKIKQPAGEDEAMTFDGRFNEVGFRAAWNDEQRTRGYSDADAGQAFRDRLRPHLRARLRSAFGTARVLLPVIHPVSHAAAMANARPRAHELLAARAQSRWLTQRMRDGLGVDGALALASGVTADNANSYLDDVDLCLVGTGLEREFGVFDPERVKQLFAVFAARA